MDVPDLRSPITYSRPITYSSPAAAHNLFIASIGCSSKGDSTPERDRHAADVRLKLGRVVLLLRHFGPLVYLSVHSLVHWSILLSPHISFGRRLTRLFLRLPPPMPPIVLRLLKKYL